MTTKTQAIKLLPIAMSSKSGRNQLTKDDLLCISSLIAVQLLKNEPSNFQVISKCFPVAKLADQSAKITKSGLSAFIAAHLDSEMYKKISNQAN